ncbi:MAG: hypothetical protein WAK60_11285 [Sedimentisphaerales bacterium]
MILSLSKEQKMKTAITIMIALSLAAGSLYGTDTEQPPPIPAQEQPEVLTRGPVHEAFAEPVNLQIQAGLVVPNQPPANIEEIPPAERPKGDRYVWVPGYWSWDGDRNNYIWVSACWRAAPPNMSWVPGYWSQVDGGWEWVAGFWTPAGIKDIEYLPAPPVFEDVQPPIPPLSPDNIWVPSCQYWYQDHYVQRPGYWLAAHQNWVWVPSHYVWTPRGYVFCDGHWDYPLEDRGVLFAPVYFPPSVYGRLGFSYSPSIVIDIGILRLSLFTYPRYCHYYFGDYYDDAYLSIGIFPRYEAERIHSWYDPIYVYDRWHHRDEPRWEEHERHEYDLRHADKDLRPPRTYHEMEIRQAKLPEQQRNNFRMAESLTVVIAGKGTSLKFEHINAKAQRKITTQATAVHKFSAERNRWESAPASQKIVQPPMEHKGPVTPLPEHKEPVTTPAEHKGPVMPPAEHKEPVATPAEHKGPATPPAEHKEPIATPAEHKGPVTPPAEHKEQVTQPRDTNTPSAPPREVHITKPERVKVPAPPVVGKQGAADKGPPPRPANERKDKGEVKDMPKENQRTNDANDTNKDKGKGKGK